MERQSVASSNVAAVGYDPDKQEMEVEFTNGATYLYKDVPPETHAALMNASSIGSYIYHNIRGKHATTRIS